MSQRWTYVLALPCLIPLVIAGCAPTQATPASSTTASTLETTGTTYVVQRGTVTRKLEFAGRVAPVEEVPLYFKTGGFVKEVHVQQGDRVAAGHVLADLEPEFGIDRLENQLASAELNLSLAQTRLTHAEEANAYAIVQAEIALETAQQELAAARALEASRTAAISSAQAGVEQAERELADAQEYYDNVLDPARDWEQYIDERICYQGEGGAVPCTGPIYSERIKEERKEAPRALQTAQGNLQVARAQYDQAVAAEAVYRHELRIAEIAVEQAQAELEQLEKGVDRVLSLEVRGAQQQLDMVKEGSQLVSPVDGEVVSLSLYPGRPVEPFVPVVVIADPSAIEVSAGLTDDQLQQVTEGQQAKVVLSTDPERTWSGVVRRLPYPYGTGGSVESPTGVDTSTRISLDGDVSDLRLGALLQVSIVLGETTDVLWLPPAAVGTLQGRSFVTLREGGRQLRVDVELGLQTEDRVEILRGMREGQVVVAP